MTDERKTEEQEEQQVTMAFPTSPQIAAIIDGYAQFIGSTRPAVLRQLMEKCVASCGLDIFATIRPAMQSADLCTRSMLIGDEVLLQSLTYEQVLREGAREELVKILRVSPMNFIIDNIALQNQGRLEEIARQIPRISEHAKQLSDSVKKAGE